MNTLIYGLETPRIDFVQQPTGVIAFHIKNKRTIRFSDSDNDINWIHLYWGYEETPFPSSLDESSAISRLTDELISLTGSPAERKFLCDYIAQCQIAVEEGMGKSSVWDYPALIPQVWVNWIAYDSKDKGRAIRAQKEPFRVDFMMKDKDLGNEFVIFEIDGPSHFGAYEENPPGAMIAYTEHLRKDRWLRKQGWNVIRLSNYEIEKCTNFNDFFYDLTGKHISIPF